MKGSVQISATVEDTSVKAKQDGMYIYVAPGTTNTEVAATIGVSNYEVTNSANKAVSNSAKAGTGYIFKNKTAYLPLSICMLCTFF